MMPLQACVSNESFPCSLSDPRLVVAAKIEGRTVELIDAKYSGDIVPVGRAVLESIVHLRVYYYP